MENLFISDPRKLDKTLAQIKKDGIKNFHVVSDFDRTLTKCFVNGDEISSVISILRNGNYLTKDYAGKANALFNKYHPIEIDPEVPYEKKRQAMEEWWMSHFKLLIESGLNKKDIEKVVQSEKIKLRDGAPGFLKSLYENQIPLVILSSAGLGKESISLYLEKEKNLYKNIHIISNSFKWDADGKVISVNKPIIHVLSKDEVEIKNQKFYKKIENRKNVLLLGDNIEDVNMVKGFPYENLIKIGFLNSHVDKNLEAYKKNFDVLILNDGDTNLVNGLLKKILG